MEDIVKSLEGLEDVVYLEEYSKWKYTKEEAKEIVQRFARKLLFSEVSFKLQDLEIELKKGNKYVKVNVYPEPRVVEGNKELWEEYRSLWEEVRKEFYKENVLNKNVMKRGSSEL